MVQQQKPAGSGNRNSCEGTRSLGALRTRVSFGVRLAYQRLIFKQGLGSFACFDCST